MCNICSLDSPHGAIQPFLLNEEEVAYAPQSFTTINTKGAGEVAKYKLRLGLRVEGLGACVEDVRGVHCGFDAHDGQLEGRRARRDTFPT